MFRQVGIASFVEISEKFGVRQNFSQKFWPKFSKYFWRKLNESRTVRKNIFLFVKPSVSDLCNISVNFKALSACWHFLFSTLNNPCIWTNHFVFSPNSIFFFLWDIQSHWLVSCPLVFFLSDSNFIFI